jgi:hypothetical protein
MLRRVLAALPLPGLRGSAPAAPSFPPYRLLERDYLAEAEAKYQRLERLYHIAQRQSWDGKAVLKDLLAKHGGVKLAPEKKAAIARIFSLILWGELAAWNIAADIAEMLDNTEAKMAASGQVFDEARHFYTLRDYLLELEVEVPPLDAYTRALLIELLEADNVHQKLIGMQLLVENVAVHLFKAVAESGVEPVLAELMPFFERDEARHVGLGVLYLPEMLSQVGRVEATWLQLFQVKVFTMVMWASVLLRPSFDALGIDLRRAFEQGMRSQMEIMESVGRFERNTRGVYNPGGAFKNIHEATIRYFFPRLGAPRPTWLKAADGLLARVARGGERVMEWAA